MIGSPTGPIKTRAPWGNYAPIGGDWANLNRWDDPIERATVEFGRKMPPWVIKAMMVIESLGNPNAYRPADGYDAYPAIGLMQVKPYYHQWRIPDANPYDPVDNIRLGVKIMSDAIDQYKTWELALTRVYFPGTDTNGTSQGSYVRAVQDLGLEMYAGKLPSNPFDDTSTPAPTPAPKKKDTGVTIGNRPLRIALGTGHANTSGGNSFELALGAKCTNVLYRMLKELPEFDVRCYTPNDGLGMFPGPLDAAAAQVRRWAADGWAADILHEVHHEGTGTPTTRGGFFIYPDSRGLSGRNAGDQDTDVKNAGGEMARRLVAAFGGVTRWNPPRAMSEKETGVGAQGYRLGVFGAWADEPFVSQSFRFISEASAYTNPQDLAIMQREDYPTLHAKGMIEAYRYLAKEFGRWTYPEMGELPVVVKPTKPKRPRFDPIPGPLEPKLINNYLFFPVERTLSATRNAEGRQFADPKAAAVMTIRSGDSIIAQYLTIGGDGNMWVVTPEGIRFPADAFVAARQVQPGKPDSAPPPSNGAAGLSVIEQNMLDTLNAYRRQNGRGTVEPQPQLNEAAQYFATDMAQKKYFSYQHLDSKGRTWRQRFDAFGFTEPTAGENIGWGYSVKDMFNGWVDSPPHRENILNPNYRYIGIGYDEGSGQSGVRKVWVTDFGA